MIKLYGLLYYLISLLQCSQKKKCVPTHVEVAKQDEMRGTRVHTPCSKQSYIWYAAIRAAAIHKWRKYSKVHRFPISGGIAATILLIAEANSEITVRWVTQRDHE